MGYYRGDYYRGDYYRGDLGGFFKAAGKAIGGAAKGFLTGGPIGALTGAVTSITARSPSNAALVPAVGTSMGIGGAIGTAIRIGARSLPAIGAGIAVEKGFGALFGGRNGKRRTMNHLNPKALSRATRRVEGFVKKARKAVSPLGYTVVRRGSGGRCAPKRKCR